MDIQFVREWDEVTVSAEDPHATRVHGTMLLGLKGSETIGGGRWKARFVAGGHNARDGSGRGITEQFEHLIPAGLGTIRCAIAWEGLHLTGVSLLGDVEGAYVKSKLRGNAMWISLPKFLQPASWSKYRLPVTRVIMALYGLKRSGLDWGVKARKVVLSLGFEPIRDFTDDSIFLRGPVLLIIYTDDFLFSGPHDLALQAWKECNHALGFSTKLDGSNLLKILGIRRSAKWVSKTMKHITLDQEEYIKHIVENFQEIIGNGKSVTLPSSTTPAVGKETVPTDKQRAESKKPLDDEVAGFFADTGPEHVGKLWWIARGTRPDICYSVARLARRVRKWTKLQDKELLRIYKYLAGTSAMCLFFVVDVRDMELLGTVSYSDSDHAGDPGCTAKSTSGWMTYWAGPCGSRIMVHWGSRLQGFKAKSTPEAEVIAMMDATARSLAPYAFLLDSLLGRRTLAVLATDNDAGRLAALRGYSRALAYLVRYQRVSLGWLGDFFSGEFEKLLPVRSGYNHSDCCTKSLEAEAFWKAVSLVGLGNRQ